MLVQYKSFRLYTQIASSIRFPQNPKNPFLILYFSENSTFLEDYKKLGFRLIDLKVVVIPITMVPRTRLLSDTRKLYKKLGIYAYNSTMKVPEGKNIVFDLSNYFKSIDSVYKPKNYRQRAGFLIKNLLLRSFMGYPPNYEKVLLYTIDITKPFNQFISRKFFPVLQQIKEEDFPFNSLIMGTIGEHSSRYRLLIKDKKVVFPRILQYTKQIKHINIEEEEKEEVHKATNDVVKSVEDKIDNVENKEKVKTAVSNFLLKDKKSVNKIMSGKTSKDDYEELATAAIMYSTSGNIDRSKRLSKLVPSNKKSTVLKNIEKTIVDEIIPKTETKTTSTEVSVQLYNIPNMVDNKSPEHLFQKRQIDFKTNLEKDMSRSFGVLSNKEIPLKVEKIEIVDKKQSPGEIDKSDLSVFKTTLKDEFGNKHNIQMDLPKIDPISGTFRINGKRKALINQIVQCPISFPKPYDSRFESSYSRFHIWSKRTKKYKFLEGYLATYKLPLIILLSYFYGFDNTLKDYGIKYKITNKKEKGKKFLCKIDNERFIIFEDVNSELKEEMCESFIRAKVDSYKITKELFTKEYFNDLIIKMTGQIKSTFLISSILENIVDPVAKQVLMNQQLPTDLRLIMRYMTEKVITGFVQDRNDLANQRIRGSEILVHLAQKQILASYTEYKEQVLSGNKNAKFNINSKKLLSDFLNSELVTDMEYANPLEEMSTMSRITPVGKSIGGIPDKRSLQSEARNVHNSYFGNVDPLDTPEGENIGVVQQLSIGSLITSARGLIQTKEVNNSEGSGMLSTSTCMIPFVENNEGARIMMAANQSRQMLPLKNPESPAVQSGYESVLTNVLSDSFLKKSPCDGKIDKVFIDHITINCKDNKKTKVEISPVHLKSGSGKNTLSIFKPIVKSGQSVKKGDIIAEGSCINGGAISLGKTLCVAVFPYKGYNFEDGIVINERLVDSDSLTSLHGIEDEVLISENDRILFIANIGDNLEKGTPLLKKTIGEIEQLIGFDEEMDESEDITGGQFIKKSPGGKIVDIDVFSNMSESKFPKLKNLIERTKKKYKTSPGDKFKVRGENIKGVLIRFRIEQELKIGLGDKLCNRYGNKGIISLIEKDKFMPETPWGDKVDMIINPLGIISRMNIGQLYELYCGLISKGLALKISSLNDKNKVISLLQKVLPLLDKDSSNKFSSKTINNFRSLSDKKFSELVLQIKSKKFFPIIIPPFKAPKFNGIKAALKYLGLETNYNLHLPEFNTKTKNKVPVGYQYISKLEHIGDLKIHSRSTGPVTGKTMQPTAGKRAMGGQRLGELDSYALMSYDCTNILSEFFGPLSDDHITKNEIIADIIQTGSAKFRPPKSTPTKDLLNSYFISLMLGK